MILSAEKCNMRLDSTRAQVEVVELRTDFETAGIVS